MTPTICRLPMFQFGPSGTSTVPVNARSLWENSSMVASDRATAPWASVRPPFSPRRTTDTRPRSAMITNTSATPRRPHRLGHDRANGTPIAADALAYAINNELRRIDRIRSKHTLVVCRLPAGELRGRKRVAPAQSVPIVHVLLDGDQLRAVERLRVRKLTHERVCRWTARTAFGREQLGDNDGRCR